MIIWLLAFILFGCLGLAGFTLGVIRAICALFGLMLGTLLAMPLSHAFYPLIHLIGVKNPAAVFFLGPLFAFLAVLIACKVAGAFLHRKVDVYFKYKAGDLRLGLWNRLNPRLGLCVGLANASIYLTLICLVIYILSYPTTQMVSEGNVPATIKLLNLAGKNLQDSGFSKVTAAIDPMPESYYQASDLIGLIYHNDLAEAGLSRYPALLALGEKQEFQEIASDKEFTEMRQKQAPIMDIFNNGHVQSIMNNPDLLQQIWEVLTPDLPDLLVYLHTGQSAKYDSEKILGRWDYNLNGAIAALKRSRPNLSAQELKIAKRVMNAVFSKMVLVAAPNKQVFLKNFGKVRPTTKPTLQPEVDLQNFQGQWSASSGSKYQITFTEKTSGAAVEADIEGDKMIVTGDAFPMVFDREL